MWSNNLIIQKEESENMNYEISIDHFVSKKRTKINFI